MVHRRRGHSLRFDNLRVAHLKQKSPSSDLARPCWHSNRSRICFDSSGVLSSYRQVSWCDYPGTPLELGLRNGRHQHSYSSKRGASKETQNEVGAGTTASCELNLFNH